MGIGVANQVILNGDERIDLARSLVEQLEAGDDENINETIDRLTNIRESQLFMQVGQLTRQLHDSLGNCSDGEEISSLASKDIPNARERLNYVIEKTEESANRTLTAIEATVPISEELEDSAKQMTEKWEKFKRREMTADDFRSLSKEISAFLETVSDKSTRVHEYINEILMAQEYQDLTGQTIKQVIEIVERVETNLVELIKCQGISVCGDQQQGPDLKAEGPQMNTESNNVMSDQDEVDDLLSSLGF